MIIWSHWRKNVSNELQGYEMKIKMYIENDNGVKNKIEIDNVDLNDGINLNAQAHKIIDFVANYKNEWIDPKISTPEVGNRFYLIIYEDEFQFKAKSRNVVISRIYSMVADDIQVDSELKEGDICFLSRDHWAKYKSIEFIVGYFPLEEILVAAQKKFMFSLDDYRF